MVKFLSYFYFTKIKKYIFDIFELSLQQWSNPCQLCLGVLLLGEYLPRVTRHPGPVTAATIGCFPLPDFKMRPEGSIFDVGTLSL